jgi:hypothetical protein
MNQNLNKPLQLQVEKLIQCKFYKLQTLKNNYVQIKDKFIN